MSEFQRPQRMWPDLHLPELPRSRGAAQVFPSLQASRPPEGHLPSPLPSPRCSPGPSGSLQPMVPPSNTQTSPAPQPRASVRPPAFPLVPRGVSGAGHRGGRGRGWIPVPAPGPGPPGLCGGPDPPSLLQEGGRAEGPAREVCTGVCARGALCIHMCAYMCIWAHMDVHTRVMWSAGTQVFRHVPLGGNCCGFRVFSSGNTLSDVPSPCQGPSHPGGSLDGPPPRGLNVPSSLCGWG